MDIEFNGGDEIRQPFQIKTSGQVTDLTGCTITASIFLSYGRSLQLAEGNGIEVENRTPEGDQPHGLLILNEEQTKTFPSGRQGRLRLIVSNAAGVTMSTVEAMFLRRA